MAQAARTVLVNGYQLHPLTVVNLQKLFASAQRMTPQTYATNHMGLGTRGFRRFLRWGHDTIKNNVFAKR